MNKPPNLKVCSSCIYDETIPQIVFDKNGVCNYCHQISKIEKEFKTGLPQGIEKFNTIVNQIKIAGKNKKYDVIVGVSGRTSFFAFNISFLSDVIVAANPVFFIIFKIEPKFPIP